MNFNVKERVSFNWHQLARAGKLSTAAEVVVYAFVVSPWQSYGFGFSLWTKSCNNCKKSPFSTDIVFIPLYIYKKPHSYTALLGLKCVGFTNEKINYIDWFWNNNNEVVCNIYFAKPPRCSRKSIILKAVFVWNMKYSNARNTQTVFTSKSSISNVLFISIRTPTTTAL